MAGTVLCSVRSSRCIAWCSVRRLSALGSAITTVGGTLGNLLDSGWEALKSAASAAADAMPGLIQGGFSAMTTAISGIGDGLGSLLDAGWEALKSGASAAAEVGQRRLGRREGFLRRNLGRHYRWRKICRSFNTDSEYHCGAATADDRPGGHISH